MGFLDVANCAGGGVTVTATAIDWQLPVDGTNGGIVTGTTTNLTYSGGTLGSGVTGTILDLSTSTSLPLSGFMTFSGTPLNFTLTSIAPGSSNTACAALSNFQTCSVSAGSPFVLELLPGGQTSITLVTFGTATDGSGTSNWQGLFTAQLPNMTPAQIQT